MRYAFAVLMTVLFVQTVSAQIAPRDPREPERSPERFALGDTLFCTSRQHVADVLDDRAKRDVEAALDTTRLYLDQEFCWFFGPDLLGPTIRFIESTGRTITGPDTEGVHTVTHQGRTLFYFVTVE